MTTSALAQTVNVNGPLPAAAGTVPVADGTGGYNSLPLPAGSSFASNAANGPALGDAIGTGPGTRVLWENIDNGGVSSTSVLVTPTVTGRVRIICTLVIFNSNAVPVNVLSQVQIGGVTQTNPQINNLIGSSGVAGGFGVTTFTTEVTLPVGITSSIQIFCTADATGMSWSAHACALDIQELPAATG